MSFSNAGSPSSFGDAFSSYLAKKNPLLSFGLSQAGVLPDQAQVASRANPAVIAPVTIAQPDVSAAPVQMPDFSNIIAANAQPKSGGATNLIKSLFAG